MLNRVVFLYILFAGFLSVSLFLGIGNAGSEANCSITITFVPANPQFVLEKFKVELFASGFSRIVETDSSNRVAFLNLPYGRYQLRVISDHYELPGDRIRHIKFSPDSVKNIELTVPVELQMESLPGIRIKITDTGGTPLKDAEVLLRGPRVREFIKRTDEKGEIAFLTLPEEGAYLLQIEKKGYEKIPWTTVKSGQGVKELSFTLRTDKELSGEKGWEWLELTVRGDVSDKGVQNLPGVKVELKGSSKRVEYTDYEGKVFFKRLARGEYFLVFYKEGYLPVTERIIIPGNKLGTIYMHLMTQ